MAAIRIGLVSLLCSKVRSISPRQGSSLCALLSNRSPPLLSSLSAAGQLLHMAVRYGRPHQAVGRGAFSWLLVPVSHLPISSP
eukprot:COSAG01_NODE_7465_length_3194_cov_11.420323_4_plen_82_part_01